MSGRDKTPPKYSVAWEDLVFDFCLIKSMTGDYHVLNEQKIGNFQWHSAVQKEYLSM